MGLRVVDRRSRVRPTWRQAAVRSAIAAVPDLVLPLVPSPHAVQAMQDIHRAPDMVEMRREMERMRRATRPVDFAQFERRIRAVYEAHGVTMRGTCGQTLLGALLNLLLTGAVLSGLWRAPLHQTLYDRVSGTLVVRAPSRRRP